MSASALYTGGLLHLSSSPTACTYFQTRKAFPLVYSSSILGLTPGKSYGFGIRSSVSKSLHCKCSGMHQRESESNLEPFWVTLSKEAISGLRSLVLFLVEQPSQLKHIEWPGFQSTLKTATLTLVLVAILIVALTSIDSALSYLLAMLLRKSG